jgi:hypothetical protein
MSGRPTCPQRERATGGSGNVAAGYRRRALGALKAKLAAHQRTHALFDTARFCRGIEAAYVTMLERHRRGEPPQGFAVAASNRPVP